jgi:TetR/AcrR family transcriptional regulator, tetracycline repressor protein
MSESVAPVRPSPMKTLRYGELDRQLVVSTAMRLAESGGIRRVTVRALAAELGLSTTAMYHHVKDKRELLNLVAQATLAAIDLPQTGPWQQRLRIFARSARQSLLRIDGIADVLQAYPAEGAARQVDSMLHQLVLDAGVPPGRREAARMLLMVYVMGSVSFEQALDGLDHDLTVPPDVRFEQGLDMVVAGLEARIR